MRAISLTLFFLVNSYFQFLYAQQTPKTMLWRISGNGFSKNCYLYGTMHTKDKRAYYLGDSVYSTIKACDGFAMEIDPAEHIDTVLTERENKELDIEYRKAIETDLLEKGPDYYKKNYKAFDSAMAAMRKKFRNMSLSDYNRLERAYRRRMKNDMKTRLDLYLFDLAKTQGKVVGAVEDLADQTSIKRIDDKPFDEEAFLKKQKGRYADMMEWMIETYADAELDKLAEFSLATNSPAMRTIMLYNRNDKMARRIDSLGRIRSSFCAVGCAHLPGDSGVISLLRKRGFTVEPVFSSKKIEPGDMVIDNQLKTLIDITDADSNYIVQMPGKPTAISSITDKIAVRAYKELSNEILLLCGVYEDGRTYRPVDKVLADIKDFFSRHETKVYDTKKITHDKTDGYEISFRNHEGYMRMHLFVNNGKTYIIGAGSREKDSMYSIRCNNYLDGYKLFFNRARAESKTNVFTSAEKAFSIAMVNKPRKENIKGNDTYTKEDVTLFTSVDTKSKTSYLVMIKEPFKGYFPNFDSSVFVQTVSEIKKDIYQKHEDDRQNILLDGYPALKIRTVGESDGKKQYIYSVMAMRQNRFYCITARGLAIPENETIFQNYINSFHFEPYTQSSISLQQKVDSLFSVKAPSSILIFNHSKDSAAKRQGSNKTGNDYYAFDTITATTYAITSLYPGKFYWVADEPGFLSEYASFFFDEKKAINNIYNEDSLLYKKEVRNYNVSGKELLLKNIRNNSFTRLRIMCHADSAFVINMKGSRELLTDATADSFFNSFRFTSDKKATAIYVSKTQALINSLQSKDSIECTTAIDGLRQGLNFPATDMALLLNSLLNEYRTVEMKTGVYDLLAQTIAAQATQEMVDFIKKTYPELKGKKENIRMLMFDMLAGYKTSASYDVIKQFLLNDLPSPVNLNSAMLHFATVPSLTASFFPELSVKIKDNYMGADVLNIASMLIDSNKLSYDILRPLEEDITKMAKKILEQYQYNDNEEYYVPNTDPILKLLVKMNNKKAQNLLDYFVDLKNSDIMFTILMEMAKAGQSLPVNWLDKYGESPRRRILLYDELYKIRRQSLFTGKHATQKSFAEAFAGLYTDSQVFGQINKDYDLATIKEEKLNGKLYRFYVFKVKCHYTYENRSYTCIIGPFDTDNNNLSILDGGERYILYKVKYNEDDIEGLFADYINKIAATL